MPGSPFSIPASTLATRTWAILPGVREWVLLALLVVALFGRSNPNPSGRSLAPLGRWLRPLILGRREPAWVSWMVDRWRLVLALLAGAGLFAWVATSFRVAQVSP